MAVDEALLRSRLAGEGAPTVRFFAWEAPAISLGYGQALDDRIDVALATRLGIGVVRRPTGGGAVYHDTPEREVTYSVVGSSGDYAGFDDLLETYRIVGSALVRGLQRLGVPADLVPVRRLRGRAPAFCFARTGNYEVEVAGKKLIGSAQRRQAGAFLQHGSILVGADAGRLRLLFPDQDPLGGLITIESILGWRPGFAEMVRAMVAGFEELLGASLLPGALSEEELGLAARLVATKYGARAWTERGELPPESAPDLQPPAPARSC